MPNVLYSKIEQKLLELEQIPNSMIVLKGIPMEAVFPEYAEKIQLETLTKNKLGYMMNLVSERSVITYEEFLLLYDFIVSQYSAVFILNNNIYMNQYPLEMNCSETARNGLLTHFRDVEDNRHDDEAVGDIQELISLYILHFPVPYIAASRSFSIPRCIRLRTLW